MLAQGDEIRRIEVEQDGLLAGKDWLGRTSEHHMRVLAVQVDPLQSAGGIEQAAENFHS